MYSRSYPSPLLAIPHMLILTISLAIIYRHYRRYEARNTAIKHLFARVQDDSYHQEVETELLHCLCTSVAAGALPVAPHAVAALGTDGGLLETLHRSKVYEERPLLATLTLLELLCSSPALAPSDGRVNPACMPSQCCITLAHPRMLHLGEG